MAIINSMPIGAEICEILGLDPSGTGTVKFNFTPGRAVKVEVEGFMTDEQAKAFKMIIKDYVLIER